MRPQHWARRQSEGTPTAVAKSASAFTFGFSPLSHLCNISQVLALVADVKATTTVTAGIKHILFTAANSLGLVPTETAICWLEQIAAAAAAPPADP